MFCTIRLDGPPRGKGRGRAVATDAGARVYTDAKTRSYEAQLRFAAQQAMAGRLPTALPVRLTMSVFFAAPQSASKKKRAQMLSGVLWPTVKPDADNTLKLTEIGFAAHAKAAKVPLVSATEQGLALPA